jgi:hypothetical protein
MTCHGFDIPPHLMMVALHSGKTAAVVGSFSSEGEGINIPKSGTRAEHISGAFPKLGTRAEHISGAFPKLGAGAEHISGAFPKSGTGAEHISGAFRKMGTYSSIIFSPHKTLQS